MFDVSPLVPEARPIVEAAARIYLNHLQKVCIGILVHGSALKGGFIPGCSDIDFQLYLKGTALEENGQLPVALTMAIQHELATIDPAPFQYIQAYAKSPDIKTERTKNQVGPIPGAYHMIYGHLSVPEATAEQIMQGSRRAIERVPTAIADTSEDLLGTGGGHLERRVRYICTDVWPTLYSVLTLQSQQPLEIWRLPKGSAFHLLPAHTPMGRNIRRFYQCAVTYYGHGRVLEEALAVIETGVAFLQAVEEWYAGYLSTDHKG
ncbi:hypothetical protein [Dictyobacter kobayashii]|uniref:Polymerase nucleotidyl transferase domain-containing protein n=1 Tax=Dictyobacter kobayashii TaxID=2014872 RepID=A0A402AL92_9CHLR|nr:hypothetical protein [Dictyobacter kobayashii]GCE19819.1 hypothetical protein KDK_36190 [Dictyobacter kobayashii]